jgi:PAS domain S-box-containing protein
MDLRKRAEEKARLKAGQMPEDQRELPPEEARLLLHDLRVHQIELEMQNEELRRAQVELEASRARYFDLYDLAPVGYLTLSDEGQILEANLAAARLLGAERSLLAGQPLTHFILPEDQDVFYRYRKEFLAGGKRKSCELRMLRPGASPLWVRWEESMERSADGAPMRRAVMSDISEVKTLRGFLPICAGCKKIRDDKGFWESVERYVTERSTAQFSHSLCPDCAKSIYGDIYTEEIPPRKEDGK